MTPSSYISITLWSSILIIIFGLLTKVFDNDFTTWILLIFLIVVGFLKWAIERSDFYHYKDR